jgi:hypothetical protein
MLSNGEMFGEEDLIKNKRRSYSIKCISPQGIVRIISKKNFIQRVLIDKTTQNMIEQKNKVKENWFNKKIEETQKIFQSNKQILTQNMSKDLILNQFLKNNQNKKSLPKSIDVTNIDKMRITKFFQLKTSIDSQSLEAKRYPEEKQEFLKIKSDFERKHFSLTHSKNKS